MIWDGWLQSNLQSCSRLYSYSHGMSIPILLLLSYLPLQLKTERGISTSPQTPDQKQCQRTFPSAEPQCNLTIIDKLIFILITTRTSTIMPCMQRSLPKAIYKRPFGPCPFLTREYNLTSTSVLTLSPHQLIDSPTPT